jgi:hypothetical protein
MKRIATMSPFLGRFSALLISGALIAAAGTSGASARMGGPQVFRAAQALSYVVGSKRAIGYFQTVAGKCQVTLMIAEAVDPDVGQSPSAARMIFAMAPGQSMSLGSAEGEQMTATCGDNADTLEVTKTSAVRT